MQASGAVRYLSLAAVLALTACSSVPDAVNPVEWYRGATGWLRSDEEVDRPAERDRTSSTVIAARAAESETSFPSLASVPERPKPTLDPMQRRTAVRDLQQDRSAAREEARELRASPAVPPHGARQPLSGSIDQPAPGTGTAPPETRPTAGDLVAPAATPPVPPPVARSEPRESASAPPALPPPRRTPGADEPARTARLTMPPGLSERPPPSAAPEVRPARPAAALPTTPAAAAEPVLAPAGPASAAAAPPAPAARPAPAAATALPTAAAPGLTPGMPVPARPPIAPPEPLSVRG